jgi:hypothetical protein
MFPDEGVEDDQAEDRDTEYRAAASPDSTLSHTRR